MLLIHASLLCQCISDANFTHVPTDPAHFCTIRAFVTQKCITFTEIETGIVAGPGVLQQIIHAFTPLPYV